MAGKKPVIIDTAAIFGMLDKRDEWHAAASRLFLELPKPFITCEAVISETSFLLEPASLGNHLACELVKDGSIVIDFDLGIEIAHIAELMQRYANVPMSLADACLVRMSEIIDAPVFTFDTDFLIYRRSRRRVIPLIGIDQ